MSCIVDGHILRIETSVEALEKAGLQALTLAQRFPDPGRTLGGS